MGFPWRWCQIGVPSSLWAYGMHSAGPLGRDCVSLQDTIHRLMDKEMKQPAPGSNTKMLGRRRHGILEQTPPKSTITHRPNRTTHTEYPLQTTKWGLVWLATKKIPIWGEARKLAPRFIGPFPITKKINPITICLKLPTSMRIHPVFHVSQVKPHTSPLQPPKCSTTTSPRTIDI